MILFEALRPRVMIGDALSQLRTLPDSSVHCCVTSPPYWGLRPYLDDADPEKPHEIGLEETPDAYVARLVEVFREVKRVLRDDGTLWLNLGDSYDNGKQLVGIPWRVAFALQADGWRLRQDIIWAKPNPMPESVTDRCTKSHEYLFLLAKSERYYYDAEAVKEEGAEPTRERYDRIGGASGHLVRHSEGGMMGASAHRNRRSVWFVSTSPYAGAHFATFPPKLIEPCILAGTSAMGCCAKCGAPREREVETTREHESDSPRYAGCTIGSGVARNSDTPRMVRTDRTVGWRPGCECGADTVPCVVLDPFVGSGTTLDLATSLQRASIGIDLNPKNAKLIAGRLS